MVRNLKLTLAVLLLVSVPAIAGHHLLSERLNDNGRSDADQQRDAGRKPVEVLAFLGISEGMTVLDVVAASGYYTEVLSLAVGDSGRVYAQNPAQVLKFRDGANDKALTARLANDRLSNVTRLDQELAELEISPGSLDAAVTALNFHDIYNGAGEAAALGVSRAIFAVLKPGGVFGVIDHNGDRRYDNAKLHRMPMADAIEVLEEAGFHVASTDILRNRNDDHQQGVFTQGLRGNTDRFVLLARKPLD